MKIKFDSRIVKTIVIVAVFSAISSVVIAQDGKGKAAATPPAMMPFADLPQVDIKLPEPAALPDPAAKVGDVVISGKAINESVKKKLPMIEKNISNRLAMSLMRVPKEKREEVQKSMMASLNLDEGIKKIQQDELTNKVMTVLLNKYLAKSNVELNQKDYQAMLDNLANYAKQSGKTVDEFMADNAIDKSTLKDQVRFKTLVDQQTTTEKLAAFVKAHPDYFNGTKVTVSHILIKAMPLENTTAQKAALDKIKKLKADIEAGKITFAEAANKESACPSGKKKGGKDGQGDYGDLDDFQFAVGKRMQMVPSFAEAAFALKKGQICGPIQSTFGFHLIQCTDRVEGKEPQNPEASAVAKEVIQSNLLMDVFKQALTDCPIVIYADKAETKTAACCPK